MTYLCSIYLDYLVILSGRFNYLIFNISIMNRELFESSFTQSDVNFSSIDSRDQSDHYSTKEGIVEREITEALWAARQNGLKASGNIKRQLTS